MKSMRNISTFALFGAWVLAAEYFDWSDDTIGLTFFLVFAVWLFVDALCVEAYLQEKQKTTKPVDKS